MLKEVLLRSGDGQLLLSNGDIIINSRTALDKIMPSPNADAPLTSVCWRNTGIPKSSKKPNGKYIRLCKSVEK